MMLPSPEIRYDVASAISQGRRDYQEDAIIADFPLGSELGFVVLSDGMGGHSAGDVASKIVLTEVFSELKIQSGNEKYFAENISEILVEATLAANECVSGHVGQHPATEGMGATLIAPVFIKNRLYWVSVGDSPLFLFRDGKLRQLNQDHSMAPQIDLMVESGLLGAEEGKSHPDRNCLTSVIIGNDIAHIDCPKEPMILRDGDILIVASDGLQFLSDEEIADILLENSNCNSNEIAGVFLRSLSDLDDPEQDNISFSVVKVHNHDLRGTSVQKPAEIVQEAPPTPPHQAAVVMRKPAFSPFGFLRRRLNPDGDT
ncbi:MAG: PP2C family protein-serine/threonine phosphatase [Paracoccaceae bacterium]